MRIPLPSIPIHSLLSISKIWRISPLRQGKGCEGSQPPSVDAGAGMAAHSNEDAGRPDGNYMESIGNLYVCVTHMYIYIYFFCFFSSRHSVASLCGLSSWILASARLVSAVKVGTHRLTIVLDHHGKICNFSCWWVCTHWIDRRVQWCLKDHAGHAFA